MRLSPLEHWIYSLVYEGKIKIGSLVLSYRQLLYSVISVYLAYNIATSTFVQKEVRTLLILLTLLTGGILCTRDYDRIITGKIRYLLSPKTLSYRAVETLSLLDIEKVRDGVVTTGDSLIAIISANPTKDIHYHTASQQEDVVQRLRQIAGTEATIQFLTITQRLEKPGEIPTGHGKSAERIRQVNELVYGTSRKAIDRRQYVILKLPFSARPKTGDFRQLESSVEKVAELLKELDVKCHRLADDEILSLFFNYFHDTGLDPVDYMSGITTGGTLP